MCPRRGTEIKIQVCGMIQYLPSMLPTLGSIPARQKNKAHTHTHTHTHSFFSTRSRVELLTTSPSLLGRFPKEHTQENLPGISKLGARFIYISEKCWVSSHLFLVHFDPQTFMEPQERCWEDKDAEGFLYLRLSTFLGVRRPPCLLLPVPAGFLNSETHILP
jgi:hypothetical protein